MRSYDDWKTDNSSEEERHDNVLEAKCSYCHHWAVCIEMPLGRYMCEDCSLAVDDEDFKEKEDV